MITKKQMTLNPISAVKTAVLRGNAEARRKLVTRKPTGQFALKVRVFPMSPDEANYPQKVRRVNH